jgi:N-acetylglutamate synthase-like GNAT family acetyltransferase
MLATITVMNFTIRLMRESDIAPLAAWMVKTPLWQRYGLTVARASANFQNGMAQSEWLIVAEESGDVCGFAWAIPKGAFGRSPYLRLIGVRADKAGSGIGAGLLNEVERKSAEIADDLFLLTSDFNESAQQFYKRQGYEQVGAITGYVVADVTELIFRKRVR